MLFPWKLVAFLFFVIIGDGSTVRNTISLLRHFVSMLGTGGFIIVKILVKVKHFCLINTSRPPYFCVV